MRAFSNRAVATAAAFAIVLTATGVPAFAASNADKTGQVKQTTATDLSAAKKRYRRHYGIDPAGRAFLGIAGAMVGMAAANIAADNYRQRYYRPYGHGYYGYGNYGHVYPYDAGPYHYYGYPY